MIKIKTAFKKYGILAGIVVGLIVVATVGYTQTNGVILPSTGPKIFTVPAVIPTITSNRAAIYGKTVSGKTELAAKTVDGEVVLTTGGAVAETDTLNTVVGRGATTTAKITTGEVQSGANGADGLIRIYSEEGASDQDVTFSPHANMTQDTDYILPADDGDTGQFLQTDGSGALTWAAGGGSAELVWTGTLSAAQLQAAVNPTIVGTIPLEANEYLVPKVLVAEYQYGTELFASKTLPDDADYTVIDVWESTDLPVDPVSGDAYIAHASTYPPTWTPNYIYTWDGDSWEATVPMELDVAYETTGATAYQYWASEGGFWAGDFNYSAPILYLPFSALSTTAFSLADWSTSNIKYAYTCTAMLSSTGIIEVNFDNVGHFKMGVGDSVLKFKLWYEIKSIPTL